MGCSLGCFNSPPPPSPSPSRSLYICCLLHVCCRHTSICSSYGNQASVWQPQDLCWIIFINVSTCFSEVCANDACHRFQARTPSLPRLSIGCFRSWCDKMQKHSLEPPRGTRGSKSQQQGRRHRTYSYNQLCGSSGGCWFDSQRCFAPDISYLGVVVSLETAPHITLLILYP